MKALLKLSRSLAFATVFALVCLAEDSLVKEQQLLLRKVLNDSFKEFEITTNTDRSVTKGEIVFRWDNRERGSADGCTALWYDDRKHPIAIASVYPFRGNLVHEFDLLDRRAGAIGKRDGATFWQAKDDAVLEFKPVPDAAETFLAKNRRRIQLKLIASQFSVEMTGWKPDRSDRERLRMLTTPVYRYGSGDSAHDLLDGALFLFVKGTDPEAGLLLEARKHKDGHRWEYAFIPQTSGSLEARHRKRVVWTKGRRESSPSHGITAKRLPFELNSLR